jgi:HK97 gp10 family phage protein
MPFPKSVTKVKKNGVEFVSNVDRAKYTMRELVRAAQKDTAKLLRKRIIEKLKKLPGMRKNRRLYSSSQYWVRSRELDLIIGFKHDTWYGAHSELGTKNQPARNILRSTVMENIDDIRRIQGKYLSAIEDDNRAKGLIDEGEEVGNEQGD